MGQFVEQKHVTGREQYDELVSDLALQNKVHRASTDQD